MNFVFALMVILGVPLSVMVLGGIVVGAMDDLRRLKCYLKRRQLERIKRDIKAEEFARLGLTDADLAQSRADFEAILKEEAQAEKPKP